MFVFSLGVTQPPVQWVLGTLSLPVKQPGREASYLSPSTAETNNDELCLHSAARRGTALRVAFLLCRQLAAYVQAQGCV